jgi:hypothetical protein
MAEYKEFVYPDSDPDYADDRSMDDSYGVLIIESGEHPFGDWGKYVINAQDPGSAFTVYEGELDRYIEILTWLKNYKKEDK